MVAWILNYISRSRLPTYYLCSELPSLNSCRLPRDSTSKTSECPWDFYSSFSYQGLLQVFATLNISYYFWRMNKETAVQYYLVSACFSLSFGYPIFYMQLYQTSTLKLTYNKHWEVRSEHTDGLRSWLLFIITYTQIIWDCVSYVSWGGRCNYLQVCNVTKTNTAHTSLCNYSRN